jgi:hypothetical protein
MTSNFAMGNNTEIQGDDATMRGENAREKSIARKKNAIALHHEETTSATEVSAPRRKWLGRNTGTAHVR